MHCLAAVNPCLARVRRSILVFKLSQRKPANGKLSVSCNLAMSNLMLGSPVAHSDEVCAEFGVHVKFNSTFKQGYKCQKGSPENKRTLGGSCIAANYRQHYRVLAVFIETSFGLSTHEPPKNTPNLWTAPPCWLLRTGTWGAARPSLPPHSFSRSRSETSPASREPRTR